MSSHACSSPIEERWLCNENAGRLAPRRHFDHERGLDELDAVVARRPWRGSERRASTRSRLPRALHLVPAIEPSGAVLVLVLAGGREDALRRRAVHRGRDLRRPRGAGPGGELESSVPTWPSSARRRRCSMSSASPSRRRRAAVTTGSSRSRRVHISTGGYSPLLASGCHHWHRFCREAAWAASSDFLGWHEQAMKPLAGRTGIYMRKAQPARALWLAHQHGIVTI